MIIDKNKLISTFDEFEDILKNYSLPTWDELPDIELYMEQVIAILKKNLAIYYEALGSDKAITSSMINNYVKLGIIPPPVKKKYSKKHIAYLFIVCILKQTLDMATIQKMIPSDIDDENVKQIYNSFVHNQNKAYNYVADNVRKVADPIFENEGDKQERLNDLLLQVASSANIFKILTERITKSS